MLGFPLGVQTKREYRREPPCGVHRHNEHPGTSTASVCVYLVRHGEVHNPRALRYGRLPGFPLSLRGREQARRAAAWLDAQSPRPAHVVSSPLERAVETAEIISALLGLEPPSLDERLTEVASRFEGLPRIPHPTDYFLRLISGGHDEPADTVAARVRAAVLEQVRAGTSAVLVSHQTPIWLGRASFEHGLGTKDAPLRARILPSWVFRAELCRLASITTLRFEKGCFIGASYYEP